MIRRTLCGGPGLGFVILSSAVQTEILAWLRLMLWTSWVKLYVYSLWLYKMFSILLWDHTFQCVFSISEKSALMIFHNGYLSHLCTSLENLHGQKALNLLELLNCLAWKQNNAFRSCLLLEPLDPLSTLHIFQQRLSFCFSLVFQPQYIFFNSLFFVLFR